MAVNPNLARLMCVIEENQDKISEGEYLEAMNALGALHREEQAQVRIQVQAPYIPPTLAIPDGSPPSYSESAPLFAYHFAEGTGDNLTEILALDKVKKYHPDSYYNRISSEQWMETSYETRFQLLREATEHYASTWKSEYTNPDALICPFISRHAVGSWKMDLPYEQRTFANGQDSSSFFDFTWNCVCGYTGKTKNWKKHEQSERHQEWARHRTVSRRKIEKMKANINDDEVGSFFSYAGYASNTMGLYPGGIRVYTAWQDRNEWTHPEMYGEAHRSPILNTSGEKTWFVHERNIKDNEFIN